MGSLDVFCDTGFNAKSYVNGLVSSCPSGSGDGLERYLAEEVEMRMQLAAGNARNVTPQTLFIQLGRSRTCSSRQCEHAETQQRGGQAQALEEAAAGPTPVALVCVKCGNTDFTHTVTHRRLRAGQVVALELRGWARVMAGKRGKRLRGKLLRTLHSGPVLPTCHPSAHICSSYPILGHSWFPAPTSSLPSCRACGARALVLRSGAGSGHSSWSRPLIDQRLMQ